MTRTYEPGEPADSDLIDLLVRCDGERTAIVLRGGLRLSVLNVAWGYDEGDTHAHVTTNVSPSKDGESIDLFFTDQVLAVEDNAGEIIYGSA